MIRNQSQSKNLKLIRAILIHKGNRNSHQSAIIAGNVRRLVHVYTTGHIIINRIIVRIIPFHKNQFLVSLLNVHISKPAHTLDTDKLSTCLFIYTASRSIQRIIIWNEKCPVS